MSKITYDDKVTSNPQPSIPAVNKVTGDDMTEIKTVVNDNDTSTASHIGSTSNPHTVTKAQVGLTNVDDTADADKPVSTATQTALNDKLNISENPTKTIKGAIKAYYDISTSTLEISIDGTDII